ncbi:unnamed protein product [Cylindrotheca closterium]|uniref:Protein-S-isoprenylcysteine O-methyltransferase n=1 Tax=Cylindrotheca closterium TaxID=2856 RepID=A0AAD2FRD3_9STRA|nr:unnamed protein product [Cylindrotheca closterium]
MKTSCSNLVLLSFVVHSATAFLAPASQSSMVQTSQQSSSFTSVHMKSPFGNLKFPFGEDEEAKKAAEEAAAKAAAEAAAEEARQARLAALPKVPSVDELLSKVPAVDFDISDFDIDSVVENLTPSNGASFGERGEAYFAAQAALVLCIFIGTVPFVGESLNFVFGPITALGGLALAALSVVDLGSDSLSPFPAATESSTLKNTGIYAEMRHPMYSGLMMTMLGLSIATDSASRLLLTIVLGVLLEVKSEKEEAFLLETFPDEYPAYKEQVTNKFFPTTITNELGL